jgi:hypothetical protein
MVQVNNKINKIIQDIWMIQIKMEGLSWEEVIEMKMKIMTKINNSNQKGKRKRKIIAVDI